ncbi:MAG: ATP-binding protein [Prevotellaceae bacterium]|nr:ATP-binding protein [Prevotellaceae bacterium]
MIRREIANKLLEMATKYPILTLTGPRQSGKSTLLKKVFPEYEYVSLEDPDMRMFAQEDPRQFLANYPNKAFIDEVQRVPSLFSYLQTHVDNSGKEGMYLLAGSQNFLLMQSITQSLAGRTAVMKLLPFSHAEMKREKILPTTLHEEIFKGAYPRIYKSNIHPTDFYPHYIQTYVERDVHLMQSIEDLSKFIRFVKLCAGRIGQLLNYTSLANDCGISASTAQAWISVLEASYIVYLLKPEFNNYSKRLVKTPKLYFYDTGLACSLLEIKEAKQVATHFLRGGLFENLVVNEFVKDAYNKGEEPLLSFWRDKTGNEVDLIYTANSIQYAYEIKAGHTYSSDYFKGLTLWAKDTAAQPVQCNVVYAGAKDLSIQKGNVFGWR